MNAGLKNQLIAILAGFTAISRAEVAIQQAADQSLAITTSVYTAAIDAKGNLTDLTIKGAKAFTHTFGNTGQPPAAPPTVTLTGQTVVVQSGPMRVEWMFGEDTLGWVTEGYGFEFNLDPSIKAIVAPDGNNLPLGRYGGGNCVFVLSNAVTVVAKNAMHVHDKRYIPAGYTSGGVKPGTRIENEFRLGAVASGPQLLGGVQFRVYDDNRSPLPVNQTVLAPPLSAATPHVFTLLQWNFGKTSQPLEYRFVLRGPDGATNDVLAVTRSVTLAGETANEEILPVPALNPGAYALTVAAWQGETKLKESKLRFTVAPAAPVLTAVTPEKFLRKIPSGIWNDRRPISQIFLSQNQYRTATNPDGYLNNTQDTVTPAGKAAFRTNLLAFADKCIGVMKEMDSQGVIVWDLEGYSRPGFVYVGDPRSLPTYAPAMNTVADEFFQKFRAAGLRVGVTIRPIRIFPITGAENISKWGTLGYVLYDDQKDDVVKEVSERIAYARKRWGCTLFYMDSNGYETWENGKKKGVTIPAAMLKKLREMHPDVLVLPEHPTPGGIEWTGQYAELRMGSRGTPVAEREKFPGALTVLSCGGATEELVLANWDAVAAAVARGDALFMEGWYPSAGNRMVKDLYRQADWMRKPARIPDNASTTELLAMAKHEDPAARYLALRTLAAKADVAAYPALAALLETEKDWLVRKEVIAALGALKTPESVAALAAELKKGAFGHAYYAREQLRQLGESALPTVLELARSGQRQNRMDAASLLRTILTKPALEALRALAQDKDEYVKNSAVANLNARLGL